MKQLFIITTALAFLSCGMIKDNEQSSKTTDQKQTTKKEYNTFISLSHYHPYCGGMAPTEEMRARQHSISRNTPFVFINLSTQEQKRVKTDSMGVLKMQLDPGKYAIKETYKDCTFEEFYKQNYREPSSYYLEQGGEGCYKDWWKSNLGEFEITVTDSIYSYSFQSADRCFTGNNPCLMYSGPMPP